MNKPFLLFAFCLFQQLIFCQLGSWNVVNIKYTHSEKTSLFAETQLRSLKFYDDFHYYEYKGGINYKVHPNLQVTLAAGSYQTYREGGDFVLPKNNDELRIWPQLLLNQKIGGFTIEQRYRSEFRFTSSGYRNRFRYRLGVSYVFGFSSKTKDKCKVSATNELFFTNKATYFERNRLATTFEYKANSTVTYQIGYLHQFDYKINDETGRDFFILGIALSLKRKISNT